jgi:hypothetical protein
MKPLEWLYGALLFRFRMWLWRRRGYGARASLVETDTLNKPPYPYKSDVV